MLGHTHDNSLFVEGAKHTDAFEDRTNRQRTLKHNSPRSTEGQRALKHHQAFTGAI